MKAIVLACLLPLAVAGGAWLLVDQLPAPGAPDRPAAGVRPFVAVDSSEQGNDGIIQGEPAVGLSGRYGTSYSFLERGSWIEVPSVPELNPGERDFLVSVWVWFDEFPGPGETYDAVRKGIAYTAPGEFNLEVLPEGRVRCTAEGGGGTVSTVTSTAVIPEDGWHQIGCARTGPFWSVLVDDSLQTRSATFGTISNTVPMSIGSKYGLEDRPLCRVDDVKLFVGPSSDDSISTELDVPVAISALEQGNPAGWWRLDEAASRAAGR